MDGRPTPRPEPGFDSGRSDQRHTPVDGARLRAVSEWPDPYTQHYAEDELALDPRLVDDPRFGLALEEVLRELRDSWPSAHMKVKVRGSGRDVAENDSYAVVRTDWGDRSQIDSVTFDVWCDDSVRRCYAFVGYGREESRLWITATRIETAGAIALAAELAGEFDPRLGRRRVRRERVRDGRSRLVTVVVSTVTLAVGTAAGMTIHDWADGPDPAGGQPPTAAVEIAPGRQALVPTTDSGRPAFARP